MENGDRGKNKNAEFSAGNPTKWILEKENQVDEINFAWDCQSKTDDISFSMSYFPVAAFSSFPFPRLNESKGRSKRKEIYSFCSRHCANKYFKNGWIAIYFPWRTITNMAAGVFFIRYLLGLAKRHFGLFYRKKQKLSRLGLENDYTLYKTRRPSWRLILATYCFTFTWLL